MTPPTEPLGVIVATAVGRWGGVLAAAVAGTALGGWFAVLAWIVTTH